MQTAEMYFNALIERHSVFQEAATLLIQDLPTLTPIAVVRQCQKLSTLYHVLIADEDYFFALMEFTGREILGTSYIGEFQRALDASFDMANALHLTLSHYREHLVSAGSNPPLE